jgi:hypothetical protein
VDAEVDLRVTDDDEPFVPQLPKTIQELQALAEGEMARRLQSYKLRVKIPDAALLRFIIESQKLMQRERDERQSHASPKSTNILALIAERNLPEGRQVELLVRFAREVGPERARELGLSGALAILVGDDRAGQLLALEGEISVEDDGEDGIRALEL